MSIHINHWNVQYIDVMNVIFNLSVSSVYRNNIGRVNH